MGEQGKIFISYRREDAPGDARGICDRLGRSFGEANVFIDVDRLLAGQRFDRELDKALAKCDVLIAVIGARWLEILSEHAQSGKRDYVRDEIAAALKRDIVVIPVMTGREGHMPSLPLQDDLPENIRDLVLYQKHNIVHESFSRDAAELVAAIKLVLGDKSGPRPRRAIAIAAVIALLLTAVLLGYSQGVIPWIGPSGQQQSSKTNGSTIAALPNFDAARKIEEARQKAEADAKAEDDARKKAAAVSQTAPAAPQAISKAFESAGFVWLSYEQQQLLLKATATVSIGIDQISEAEQIRKFPPDWPQIGRPGDLIFVADRGWFSRIRDRGQGRARFSEAMEAFVKESRANIRAFTLSAEGFELLKGFPGFMLPNDTSRFSSIRWSDYIKIADLPL